jgi:hypothetical protein
VSWLSQRFYQVTEDRSFLFDCCDNRCDHNKKDDAFGQTSCPSFSYGKTDKTSIISIVKTDKAISVLYMKTLLRRNCSPIRDMPYQRCMFSAMVMSASNPQLPFLLVKSDLLCYKVLLKDCIPLCFYGKITWTCETDRFLARSWFLQFPSWP